jgi:hypothetical protein
MVTIIFGHDYSMGEMNGCRKSNSFFGKHIVTFTAWVTQMFTSYQIGYAVEMAFVTISVEIWWL